jgi:hypothetical protein
VLIANASGAVSYQWYLNGNIIPGATASTYTATQSGNYSVKVMNGSGCSKTSLLYALPVDEIAGEHALEVYPNPTSGLVHIKLTGSDVRIVTVSCYTVTGELVLRRTANPGKGNTDILLDLSAEARGAYQLNIMTDKGEQITRKLTLK